VPDTRPSVHALCWAANPFLTLAAAQRPCPFVYEDGYRDWESLSGLVLSRRGMCRRKDMPANFDDINGRC
jgi:hypothetical protein